MGRAKLNMELISKEKTRNITYLKRKSGLLKKAYEFRTLCDVDTCLIIYGPNSREAEIWPSNADEVKRIISIYKNKKSDSGKKSFDLSDFFEDRKKKIEEELAKARRRNMEAKYPTWFDFLNNLNEVQLREFANVLDNKLEFAKTRVELMKGNNNNYFQNMPLEFENSDCIPMLPLGLSTQYGITLENKIDDRFNMPIMNYPPFDQGHQTCPINPDPMMMMMMMMSDDGGYYGHHEFNDGASCSNVEYAAPEFKGEVCYDAVCGMIDQSSHQVVHNNPNSIPLMRYYMDPATTLQPLPLPLPLPMPQPFMQCTLMAGQVHGSQVNEYDNGDGDYQSNNKRGRIN